MFKTTACSLALAVLCSTAFAEDQKTSSQSQSQQDTSKSGANSSSGTGADAKASSDTGAEAAAATGAGADAKAQAAGAQDPTQMFVKEAYSSNLFEIQAGQLASRKAQDDKAKQFARMMVDDHTKANQQLKQIAQSANMQISEQLDPVCQAKLQKLQQIPASEFNRKYINGQVAGHTMNVLEFRHQAQNGQNAQVKQFATQTLPKLEQHLQHAMKMAEQQLGGANAQPASARQLGEQIRDAAKSGGASDAAKSGGTSSDSDAKSGQSNTAGQPDTAGQPGQSDTAGQSGAGQSK